MPRLLGPSDDSDLTELSEKSDNNEVEARRPARPRRRSKKLRESQDQTGVSDGDNSSVEGEPEPEPSTVNGADSDSSLSLPPDSPPKKKLGRPRKSDSTVIKPAETDPSASTNGPNSTSTPSKPRRTGAGRGGGNKRKHPHEYCLTCANYGRACSGRREGHPGCAVCREPDRSKGEKLRECLWAEPEKGIFTYPQAKEILKIAQAEERAKQGKAPTKRQLPFLSEEQRKKYLSAPDAIGLVESRPRAAATAPPPVSRPLNVRPPPSVMRQRQMLSGIESHAMNADPYRAIEEDPDTIVVDRSARSPGLRSAPKLFVERGSLDDQPQATPVYKTSLPQRTATQPLTDATGRRIPYYDPTLEAYVLPAYPHSNLLPPHMQDKVANVSYVSVYDAYPFLPVVMPNVRTHPPVHRGVRRLSSISASMTSPSRTAKNPVLLDEPQPTKSPRPLDKTGTPAKRYNRSDSIVSNVSGYAVSLKIWKSSEAPHTNGQSNNESAIDETGEEIQQLNKTRFRNSSSLSSVPSAPADPQADPIEAEHQPQVSRSGSLSPEQQKMPEQAALLPTKYAKVPERKRKRVSRPASPHIAPTSAAPENNTIVVESVETTNQSVRNGRESSLSSAISVRSGSVPSIGGFSRPPIAETRRQRPASAGSSLSDAPLPVTTPAVEKAPAPVVSSGWQTVNVVKRVVATTAPKASAVRSRKKRRTTTFDIQEDTEMKKE